MYSELFDFIKHVPFKKEIWKDGELWTAVIGGLSSAIWLYYDTQIISKITKNFAHILTLSSIIFGFVLAALTFYIQTVDSWSDNDRIQEIANKIIDWHVWTVFCLWGLMGYVLLLWVFGNYLKINKYLEIVEYAFLIFMILYCFFQVFNHSLTIRWAFKERNRLR